MTDTMLCPPPSATRLARVVTDTRGATAIEYGLIVALLAMGMIAAMNRWSDANIGLWEYISSYLMIAR